MGSIAGIIAGCDFVFGVVMQLTIRSGKRMEINHYGLFKAGIDFSFCFTEKKELLEQVGIKFSIIPSNVDESKLELNGDPHETIASALIKAKDVGKAGERSDLGADTIVFDERYMVNL